MATGHQLWTWPPLGTGAALSCPVISAAWVVWGSWWHEKRRIGASPARVTLIRERAAQSADHLAEKRQKWAVVGEVVCDLGESRNTANTTTHNSDFPAPHSRQVTTLATRCVHPSRWLPPPTTPTFPHQQAEKSPQNQYVVSYNQEPSGPTHMEGTAGSTSTPHPEPTRAAEATTKPRDSRGIPGQGAETAGFEPARGYAPLPP